MFDAPFEDWYVWVGVATVSVAVLALVVGLPVAAPPDAVSVADTVDRVAASPSGAIGSTRMRADAIRIDRRRISLRGHGGTAHATVAYGPMTPVTGGELASVLAGDPPSDVFDSPTDFGTATERALDEPASWRPAPETIRVRSVSWEGVDVLLVG